MFYEICMDSRFWGFEYIDIYGQKTGKRSCPDHILNSYVSLCTSFADRKRSTAASC